jgi:hypothetical protein
VSKFSILLRPDVRVPTDIFFIVSKTQGINLKWSRQLNGCYLPEIASVYIFIVVKDYGIQDARRSSDILENGGDAF